ncbi:MAG: GvpL/GvpF family gas vesicle protein [Pseudomonadota bacterium]
MLMSAALLVRRHAVPEMTRSAHALARDATELGLKITLRGPGPCYTFADQTWDAPASTSTLEPASEGAYV